MWHSADFFRDGSVALTATEAGPTSTTPSGGLKVIDMQKGGTGAQGAYVAVNAPIAPTGTAPTLDVKVEFYDTENFAVVRESRAIPQITAKGEYGQRVISHYRYARTVQTVGGTTPNFGNVAIGLVTGIRDGNRNPFGN